MKRLATIISALVSAALMLAPAAADNLEKLKPLMKITTPTGQGPFPAILLLSGASGFHIKGGSYDDVQSDLTKLGFVVLRVDSLEVRGMKNNKDGKLTYGDQAADVDAVATYIAAQNNIKRDAINVLGWSLGGQGAIAAAQASAGIAKAVAYYPACQRLPTTELKVPTLILSGEADDVVPLSACRKLVDGMKMVTILTYPSAHHGFDNKKFDPPRKYPLGTLGYNAAAAKSAWAELEKFMAR
jgi:dienelactone hydrolase